MPELPEVETVRRGLQARRLTGRVEAVYRSSYSLRTGAHWAKAHEKTRRLRGHVGADVDRRGKYLLWNFETPSQLGDPAAAPALLIHLGMTGRCEVDDGGERPPHTHLELRFCDGRVFRFVDPRRFGGLRFGPRASLLADPPLGALGPEPFAAEFSAAHLEATLGRSRRVLRDGLLDQRVVAGIGNIYASEIAFAARIDPRVRCCRLRPSAWVRVARFTREILNGAIERGGTTLRDFRTVDGGYGNNAPALRVYGRAGQSCAQCGAEIQSEVVQARSLFWCPGCQPRPRGGWIR